MSDYEYLYESDDENESEEHRLERHKKYKIKVLGQLYVHLSNEDKRRILNAKSIAEVDRIGRDLIHNNDSTYKANRKFVYVGV